VFHRVDVIEELPARRFFTLARRLAHYQGAMRNIAIVAVQSTDPEAPPPAPVSSREPANDDAIAASVDLMAIHPVWGSVGAYAKAPAE